MTDSCAAYSNVPLFLVQHILQAVQHCMLAEAALVLGAESAETLELVLKDWFEVCRGMLGVRRLQTRSACSTALPQDFG